MLSSICDILLLPEEGVVFFQWLIVWEPGLLLGSSSSLITCRHTVINRLKVICQSRAHSSHIPVLQSGELNSNVICLMQVWQSTYWISGVHASQNEQENVCTKANSIHTFIRMISDISFCGTSLYPLHCIIRLSCIIHNRWYDVFHTRELLAVDAVCCWQPLSSGELWGHVTSTCLAAV